MNARIVDMHINLALGCEVDPATGKRTTLITRIKRTERILFRWHLYSDDALTPYALDNGLVFAFGVDNVFTAGHADLVTSGNDRFVATDWPGSDGWNPAAGRVCNLAVFKTDELASAMGAAMENKMYACIYATSAGDEPYLLFQIPLWLDGVAVEPGGGAQANEVDSYVTVSALAGILQIPAGKRLRITDAGEIIVEAVS